MVTILFTRYYEMLEEKHIMQIKNISKNVKVIIDENVFKVIPDVDILIAGTFNKEILERAEKLQWVHALAAGVDRLLFPEFRESDIVLTNSSGVHPIPISEHVLGMMLMLTRRFNKSMKSQFQKKWERPTPVELHGKTLGIVGFGSIGERIGQLGKCLGMSVIGMKRNITTTENADEIMPPEKLHDLLNRSDFVVISLPLTKETFHLFGKKEFQTMKKTAYLINVSRGKIVCEKDLVDALEAEEIAGAGLDVFEVEPLPAESPLWEAENVIVTPHYAGSTPEYFNRAIDIFCDNLQRFLKGEPLINVVNKKTGY
ncbi:MAG: D-2-hydroxyacid dehydrogenase [Theionarchaea archaeon]|nr:D-2-hydroxyacid dehydrogenase [Theionarchaea archaeon]